MSQSLMRPSYGARKCFLVVGASSGVGLQVTRLLLAETSVRVKVLVRDIPKATEEIGAGYSQRIHFYPGDVTKPETLRAVMDGVDAVICTIGARKGMFPCFGTEDSPKMVDYLGVRNLAIAAADASVPKFVLVSSMFVTRPYSFVHIFLNLLKGQVLAWKLKGENSLKEAYSNDENISFFIIRPGHLTNEGGGKYGLKIEQGDRIKSGSVPRTDVARVILEVLKEASPPNVTFEVVSSHELSDLDDEELLTSLANLTPG